MSFKKYRINITSLIFNIIVFVVLAVVFIVFTCLINFQTSSIVGEGTYSTFVIIKDISLIGMTVFGSSLISSLLIDKKAKEFEYVSNIANEVLCDPNYLTYLSSSNKRAIESRVYNCDETQIEIIRGVVDKIKTFQYYYEECNIEVSCHVSKGVSKKSIVKELKIKSFKDSYKVEKYKIHSSATRESSNNYLTIKSVSVNGVQLKSDSDYLIRHESIKPEERVLHRNGYKSRFLCEILKPITFYSNKSTVIIVEYDTSVSGDDNFTNRLPGPCKNYRLSFGISDDKHSKYEITGSAFGFMEKGLNTPNINENRFEIRFDTWSFKDDGVSLNYKKAK